MNNDGNKILDAIKKMAADDNKGLRMSTTIVDVKDDPRVFAVPQILPPDRLK